MTEIIHARIIMKNTYLILLSPSFIKDGLVHNSLLTSADTMQKEKSSNIVNNNIKNSQFIQLYNQKASWYVKNELHTEYVPLSEIKENILRN